MSDLSRAAHGVLLAAFAGTAPPAWLKERLGAGLGGICLYGNNRAPGSDLVALAREVRALDATAVLTLDEEGGDVTRLYAVTGSPHPGNAALGRHDDVDATRTVAAGIGAELAAAGIRLDLAPSADVNSDPLNPVIGTRSLGGDPQRVARHVVAFVNGLADQGVAASVKHFPGHGDTRVDSHVGLPRVSAPREVLEARELVPFRAAIEAGVATVMTSHVVLDAIDPDHPATLSRAVLTGLLREELGFDGVVVTDALDMAGVSAGLGIAGAAVASLAAGADLLCLGPDHRGDDSLVQEVVDAILAAVAAGSLDAARLLDAATRVDALRATWSAAPAPDDAAVRAGTEASARVAEAVVPRVAPLGDVTTIRLDTGTNPAVGATAWGDLGLPGTVLRATPDALPALPAGPCVVVARRATAEPRSWAWVQEVLAADDRSLLVELGWPDPALDALGDRVVVTWGQAAVLTDVLGARLRGEVER